MLDRPLSPKQGYEARRSSPYPYYAGFTEQFVSSLLPILGARPGELVLDPWNGSGTTTSVASAAGIRSIGVDINPVMTIAASVRSTPRDTIERVCKTYADAAHQLPNTSSLQSPYDYCARLFESARHWDVEQQLIIKFGLMVACRTVARSARSKNPTWFSHSTLTDLRVDPDLISRSVISSFNNLGTWARAHCVLEPTAPPILLQSNWLNTRIDTVVDHVITSPPYLTRIDYVMKTLPELIFLSKFTSIDISRLREAMLGTVLTRNSLHALSFSRFPTTRSAIELIGCHHSKASKTYYRSFFLNYLTGLFLSLKKLARLTPESPKTVTLVSQGSYYKEALIDLPAIISEFMAALDYKLLMRYEYENRRSIALVNSRSHASGVAAPVEVVATYRKSA